MTRSRGAHADFEIAYMYGYIHGCMTPKWTIVGHIPSHHHRRALDIEPNEHTADTPPIINSTAIRYHRVQKEMQNIISVDPLTANSCNRDGAEDIAKLVTHLQSLQATWSSYRP